MANEHEKKPSISLIIRGIENKITAIYHSAHTRMDKILKADDTKCWWEFEATESLIHS